MDNKVLDLLEKFYIEFTEFKTDMLAFKSDMLEFKDDMLSFKSDMLGYQKVTDGRLARLELGQERLEDKISEAFEAIETLSQINERQHQEILQELKGDIRVVELAVKR